MADGLGDLSRLKTKMGHGTAPRGHKNADLGPIRRKHIGIVREVPLADATHGINCPPFTSTICPVT